MASCKFTIIFIQIIFTIYLVDNKYAAAAKDEDGVGADAKREQPAVCGIKKCPEVRGRHKVRGSPFTIGKEFLPYAQIISDNLLRLNEMTPSSEDDPRMSAFKTLIALTNIQRRLVIADYCRNHLGKKDIVLPLIISTKYGGSDGVQSEEERAKNEVKYSNECVAEMFSRKNRKAFSSKLKMTKHFGDLVQALLEPPTVYLARQLHREIQKMGSRSSVNIEFIFETILTLHRSDIGDLKNVYKELFKNSLGGKLRERAKKKNFKIKYGENKEWMGKECRKLIAEIGQYLNADGNNEPVRVLKKFLTEYPQSLEITAARVDDAENEQNKSTGNRMSKLWRQKGKRSLTQIDFLMGKILAMLDLENSDEIMEIQENVPIKLSGEKDRVQRHFAKRIFTALKTEDYNDLTRIMISRAEVDLRSIAKRLNQEDDSQRELVSQQISEIKQTEYAKAVGDLLFVLEYNVGETISEGEKKKRIHNERWYQNLCEIKRIDYFCYMLHNFEPEKLYEQLHFVRSFYSQHLIDDFVTEMPGKEMSAEKEVECQEYIYMIQIGRPYEGGDAQRRSSWECIVPLLNYLFKSAEDICNIDFFLYSAERDGWRPEVKKACAYADKLFDKKKEARIEEIEREKEKEQDKMEWWEEEANEHAEVDVDEEKEEKYKKMKMKMAEIKWMPNAQESFRMNSPHYEFGQSSSSNSFVEEEAQTNPSEHMRNPLNLHGHGGVGGGDEAVEEISLSGGPTPSHSFVMERE